MKEAARPHELEQARELFWQWLQAPHHAKDGRATHNWDRSDPTSWDDLSFGEGQRAGDWGDGSGGVMGAASHSDAFWYVRTLPGVIGGFAAAYGTDELVTAFDRMSIQRPSTFSGLYICHPNPSIDPCFWAICDIYLPRSR